MHLRPSFLVPPLQLYYRLAQKGCDPLCNVIRALCFVHLQFYYGFDIMCSRRCCNSELLQSRWGIENEDIGDHETVRWFMFEIILLCKWHISALHKCFISRLSVGVRVLVREKSAFLLFIRLQSSTYSIKDMWIVFFFLVWLFELQHALWSGVPEGS